MYGEYQGSEFTLAEEGAGAEVAGWSLGRWDNRTVQKESLDNLELE
jgi:hypothetical protein